VTGFVSPIERRYPPTVGDERESLEAWLDYHRATLLWKLEGLDDEQLRRVMVPSGVSLLGLVKHLTEVEHSWFVIRVGGIDEPWLWMRDDDPDADFRIEPDESTEGVVQGYLAACTRSRGISRGLASLDVTFEHPRQGPTDVRWVLNHMIEETARHNGHADIFRELIDGSTGE
jgi:hypothetical protein